jgi:hypothetical protein
MTMPPPPPKKDKRRHPRRELFAAVELRGGNVTLILPARNLSLGGVLLAADGNDLGRFAVGDVLPVQIIDITDGTRRPVRATARIMRHDADAMALMWTGDNPRTTVELAALLEALRPRR